MSLQWFDFVGLSGIGFVLLAYFLLQAGKLHGASLGYQLANLFGAVFILVSIIASPAAIIDVLTPTLMQLAWIAISLYGLWRRLRERAARLRAPKPSG
ncbi:CBU_0592 family membrane protein [Silanimonas lenta]|uniref:CBU_0592 family membrane protein n=1 Tax=Silanimonas lenta TaxID=265429 RepID=UPI002FDF4B97